MGKNSHITAAAILTTLALTGCTIGETPTANNTASPQPTAQQSTTAQKSTTPQPQTQSFNNPVVPSNAPPAVPNGQSISLIPPTNSTERLTIVQKGRTDPFGQIVEPIGSTTNTPLPGKTEVPKLPPLPTVNNPTLGNTKTKPRTTTVPKKPIQVAQKPKEKQVLPKVLAGVVPPVQLKPVSPPVPQPETAKAVVVSGVVMIGKVPQAIIKVPDEPSSRYVQPGQRLMNGVLVKRIEMSQGVNPTVILEQYGIEVAKQVGELPAQESKPSTTASVSNAISGVKPQDFSVGAS